MRLLGLMICLVALTAGHFIRKELTKEQKETFAAKWHVNLDDRRSRLQRLGRNQENARSGRRRGNPKVPDNIPRVNITDLESRDLFEVNEREGIAPYLYEGDIMLSEEQLTDLERQYPDSKDAEDRNRKVKRQVYTYAQKWTDGKVYYSIDSAINDRKRASIAAALEYISSRTCISFINNATVQNRITVINGVGCSSAVGMYGNGQTLTLGNGCEIIGTVAHEFAHALGVMHMQSRSDRDDYLTYYPQNVQPAYIYNFEVSNTINYTPYEYGSFMHYSASGQVFAHSDGIFTLLPRDIDYTYTMGNRQISFYDIDLINQHYGCHARCNTSTSAALCRNDGKPNPNDCSRCLCPIGYGGRTCEERPSGLGATLTASADWQSAEISLGENTYTKRDVFTTSNHWVTAPPGKAIQVRISSMNDDVCMYGCGYNGIEIKTRSDKMIVNPRICCSKFANITYNSTLNPTPIIGYNTYYLTKFDIQYRYVDSVITTPVPTTTTTAAQTTTSTAPSTTTTTTACAPTTTSTRPPTTTTHDPTTTTPIPKTTTTTITTTTTTPKPTTTTLATTTTLKPEYRCSDTLSNAACRHLKAGGYCNTMINPVDIIKLNCAATCDLCDTPKQPCRDVYQKCSTLPLDTFCTLDRSLGEYACARSCGYCTSNTTAVRYEKCQDILGAETCQKWKKENDYCRKDYTDKYFEEVKSLCGVTCGLCGRAPPICRNAINCIDYWYPTYGCNDRQSERYCTKTCGFCENPT